MWHDLPVVVAAMVAGRWVYRTGYDRLNASGNGGPARRSCSAEARFRRGRQTANRPAAGAASPGSARGKAQAPKRKALVKPGHTGAGMLSRYGKWRAEKISGAIRLRFKVALVEKIPLFEGLSATEIRQIARLVAEREVPADTQLVKAGELGGQLFVIIDGEAVVRTRPGRTKVLKAGDYFGEMSLIDGLPRSATVQAAKPTRLLVLGQRDFWGMVDGTTSIARKIMETLCRRLREAEGANSN